MICGGSHVGSRRSGTRFLRLGILARVRNAAIDGAVDVMDLNVGAHTELRDDLTDGGIDLLGRDRGGDDADIIDRGDHPVGVVRLEPDVGGSRASWRTHAPQVRTRRASSPAACHLALVEMLAVSIRWIVCASYGLGGGPYPSDGEEPEFDLSPLDEQVPAQQLAEWMSEQNHAAKITGRQARNLNPLIIDEGDHRRLKFAWWWLHLGDRPAKFNAFNSRAESLTSRWKAGMKQRGIAPATWYVEKGQSFGLDGDAFALAAITTTATQPDGSTLLTYSIVTRAAVGEAADVHPRMPLIVPRDLPGHWLHPGVPGDQNLVDEVLAASEDISRGIKRTDTASDSGSHTLFPA